MYQPAKDIESYYRLSQPLIEKMAMIDDLADQLGALLDWVIGVDFQVIEQPQKAASVSDQKADNHEDSRYKSQLYAISLIVGDVADENAPVFLTTASADEMLIRLQVGVDLMKKLDVAKLLSLDNYYAELLACLEHYYNHACSDALEERVLLDFFEFNARLSDQDIDAIEH